MIEPKVMMAFSSMMFVIFMSMILFAHLTALDDNDTEIRVETDRIVACSLTEDVVGCVGAARGVAE